MRKILIGAWLFFFLSISCNTKKAEESESFSFVFMTDVHLQSEAAIPEAFSMAIDSINALSPDFVITGGDLIMDALAVPQSKSDSLFQVYNQLVSRVKVPVYNTIGNHDHAGWEKPDLYLSSNEMLGTGLYQKYIGKPYYTFRQKGWKFFCLNTISRTADGYTGFVDSVQINWIRKELAETDSLMPIAISVHIPLVTVYSQITGGSTNPNPAGLVTANGKEILDLFKKHNLKLVLQGHLHYLEAIQAEGITFLTGGAVCAAWWKGPRNGLEEGFLYIQINGENLSWKYKDYGWNAPIHKQ